MTTKSTILPAKPVEKPSNRSVPAQNPLIQCVSRWWLLRSPGSRDGRGTSAASSATYEELVGVLRIACSSVRAARVCSFGQYFGHIASRGLSSSSCTQSTLSLHFEQQR